MLDKYLQQLIDQAPRYGVSPYVMERAVVPVLQKYASSLVRSQYYIAESLQGDWLITVLESKQAPQQEKRVIYAFDSIDTASNVALKGAKNKLKLIPTTHLLFEIFSLSELDSVIFLQSGSLNEQEIFTKTLKMEINTALKDNLPPSAYC